MVTVSLPSEPRKDSRSCLSGGHRSTVGQDNVDRDDFHSESALVRIESNLHRAASARIGWIAMSVLRWTVGL